MSMDYCAHDLVAAGPPPEPDSAVHAARKLVAEAEATATAAQRIVPPHTFAYALRAVDPLELVQHLDNIDGTAPRSVYTLLEVAERFPAVAQACAAKTLHLCEAPGNFVNAAVRLSGGAVDWHACSLSRAGSRFYPHLMQAKKPNGHSRVILGETGTGDLLDRDTALCVVYECGAGVRLVTADGGGGEALVAAQLFTAFHALAAGGHLLLRLGDLNDPTQRSFVGLLCQHFQAVHLFKPATTPPHVDTVYAVALGHRKTRERATATVAALERLAFGGGGDALAAFDVPEREALNGVVCELYRAKAAALQDATTLARYLHSTGVVSVADVRAHFAGHLATHAAKTQAADRLLRRIRGEGAGE